MADRLTSLAAFWPYYLGEHRNPKSRALHFIGTSGFFAAVAVGVYLNPLACAVGFPIAAVLGWVGAVWVEPTRAAIVPILAMVVVMAVAAPPILGGVACAYAFAWVGHFRVEHNRPATFQYPIWSFLCDFRMWGRMAMGQLWTGDSVGLAR